MRKIDIYRDRYIELFNDEYIVKNGLAGIVNLERQKHKIDEVCKFVKMNEHLLKDLNVKDEFIDFKTSRYTVNVAVTCTGGILFSTVNNKTGYLAKPKSIKKVYVLFKAIKECI